MHFPPGKGARGAATRWAVATVVAAGDGAVRVTFLGWWGQGFSEGSAPTAPELLVLGKRLGLSCDGF